MKGAGSTVTADELGHLGRARELALRGRGRASPNPLVGAVAVRDGRVIGEGWHEGPGTPHAEVAALRAAGADARDATIICSLEPCSHHGRTPPCADALIAAGVVRVVVGCLDPLERGRSGGVAVLEAAGVEVALAPKSEAAECRELNAAFFTHAGTGRPLVTLKMATSLDGKVATASGETRWITGPESRALVHRWRADSDAVAVGIGTALADDPLLTARGVEGVFRQPARVVFDAQARLPVDGRLLRSIAEAPVVVVASDEADRADVERLEAAGVRVMRKAGRPADRIVTALRDLGSEGVQSLFLEGGPTLAEAFLAAGAVDRVAWFLAPTLIGGVAAPGALGGEGLGPLETVPRLDGVEISRIGEDILVRGLLRQVPA